jgi:O-methyltransferase
MHPYRRKLNSWVIKYVPYPIRSRLRAIIKREPVTPRGLSRPATYQQDGLITDHNADFMKDPLFMEAYSLGEQTGSWGGGKIHWRIHVACWAAYWCQKLDGDFVECGVNRGGFSRAIMHYIDFARLPKKFYLLDTFNGLVEKYISPEERKRGIDPSAYNYTECYEDVKQTFKDFPNVVIVRGAVPDTLPLVDTEKVSFLSIDMNTREPEIAAAEFFWDKLVSGGIILLDDYGFPAHLEQKIAFDKFASQRGVLVLSLPTGQGLIMKP